MTLLASRGGVPTFESEARVLCMIEADLGPLRRVVAMLAFVSETAGVLVVRFMTRFASTRRRFVASGPMTALARDLAVSALQWEIGPIVIEACGSPGFFAVAVAACVPDACFVRVAGGMTGGAFLQGFAMLPRRIVASVAACAAVRPTQRKVAEIVDEGFRIESDDIGVSAPVIRVADLTGLIAHGRRTAVKAPMPLEVELDFRVARQAEPGLPRFFEALVAG
jgi:hypothetical protein